MNVNRLFNFFTTIISTGDMRPPFPGMPPPFGLPGEHPRGPMHLDDRVGHMLPPDMMGFPPPWDPSLGPPPPEFLDGYPPPQDYDHGSRSPSHSSSSSQSSSVERRYYLEMKLSLL